MQKIPDHHPSLVVDSGILENLDIPPQQEGVANIVFPAKGKAQSESRKSYLRITYRLKQDRDLRRSGFVLGVEEIRLNELENSRVKSRKEAYGQELCAIDCQEGERYIELCSSKFRYIYDKFSGTFSEMVRENRNLLEHPMEYNIWRAPTDNDRRIKEEWIRAGYNRMEVRTYQTEIEDREEVVCIRTSLSLNAPFTQKYLEIDALWSVSGCGNLQVTLHVKKDGGFPYLTRFGVRMFVPKEYSKVEYCGLGSFESYIDKYWASYHGVFETEITQLHEDYIRPQENGSHHDCDYVRMIGPDSSFMVLGDPSLAFNASRYIQEELTEKNHNYELVESPYTILCLDYRQSGIGSNSCGPELLEKYRLNPSEFTFRFHLDFQKDPLSSFDKKL